MKNKIDIDYLCKNLAGVIGLPVRLYEESKLCLFRSTVNLLKDPFESVREEVFRRNEHVGYFIDSHDQYYGFVSFGKKRIVVGPTRQIPLLERELHEIAFENDVPSAHVTDFVSALKSLNRISLNGVVQILCLVNHVLNDGEKLFSTDISITDSEQKKLIEILEKEAAAKTVETIEGTFEQEKIHNSIDVERYMLNAVRNGDVASLDVFFSSIPSFNSGVIAQSGLRQSKNLLIVTATLVSRSAISGGMDAEEALLLSDRYIQKSEIMTSVGNVTDLNYRMVMDYAERMAALRPGKNPSKTVVEINDYILKHLSQPITVESLAKRLCKGRSRLSTDFKKETGENLSEYILKKKIEESKRLLRYTEKSSADIAFYLGFSSPSHFSRTFKKYTDQTPNEYRLSTSNG